MKEKSETNRLRRPGPKWASTAIALAWLFLAWRLQNSIQFLYLVAHPALRNPSCGPMWEVSPIVNSLLTFFGFGVPAMFLAVLIIGKDRYLDDRRCRNWNIVLVVFLSAMLLAGWYAELELQCSWGVVT